jgi:hypothetical protein
MMYVFVCGNALHKKTYKSTPRRRVVDVSECFFFFLDLIYYEELRRQQYQTMTVAPNAHDNDESLVFFLSFYLFLLTYRYGLHLCHRSEISRMRIRWA